MIAMCGGIDLTDLVGYGYSYERRPQYGDQITTLDGTDHSAKLRDKVFLRVPFIPLTEAQLGEVLSLFPDNQAYVSWTFYDPLTSGERTLQMKYSARNGSLVCRYNNGVEMWSGLVIELEER